ncbi:MAG: hypothetical protein GX958_02895 [Desulfitobacterium sp.]|nr:hypothetical protein [Desulfitobacterium sp.]
MLFDILGLWIALEHLLKTGEKHSSVIAPITNFVPKTLALDYLRRIIRDTVELIRRANIMLPPDIKDYLDKHNLEKFVTLMRDDTLCSLLQTKCSHNPLLKNRIDDMKTLLSS